MNLKETLKTLEESPEFTAWKVDHKNNYLVHAFTIFESENIQEDWQIGYYDKDSDRITVFVVGEKITKNPETEAFKEQGKIIKELKLEDYKIEAKEVFKKWLAVSN